MGELEKEILDVRERLGWALGAQLVGAQPEANVGELRALLAALEARRDWLAATADDPAPDYELLAAQVAAMSDAQAGWVAALANASALVYQTLPCLNWAGFYLARHAAGTPELVLGPFQGRVACTRIAFGSGVCGTAAATDSPQLVPWVHDFPGHIACDSASASEVVVPLHSRGTVAAVLDIDSPAKGRFSKADLDGLGLVARALEPIVADALPLH